MLNNQETLRKGLYKKLVALCLFILIQFTSFAQLGSLVSEEIAAQGKLDVSEELYGTQLTNHVDYNQNLVTVTK